MSSVDSLWLHMDTPGNLMVIEGVMMFAGSIDKDRAIQVLRRRLPDRYPVFRQIPIPSRNPTGGDDWVDAKDFDITDHLIHVTLPAPGGESELQAYVGVEMSKPIRRDRPLWEIHFIDGYRAGEAGEAGAADEGDASDASGMAMVARFHHAMADGTALARVLLELTDDDPDGDLREAIELQRPGAENVGPKHATVGVGRWVADQWGVEVGGRRHRILGRADDVADKVVGRATDVARDTARGGRGLLGRVMDPQRVNDALSLARTAPHLLNKLFVSRLPDVPMKGEVGVEKVASWSRPHDLAAVKAAGKAHGATINDVLVSCLAGAMRSYTLERGETPDQLATMVPVNLRPLDRPLPRELGNQFALVVVNLPLGEATPEARLRATKAEMDGIKNSSEALLTFGVIGGMGAVSASVTKWMVSFFSSKAIGVTTNVPGPRTTRYFAGVEVSSVLGWAPSAGNQTLNTCIFSCAGKIRVGFKADAANVPQVHDLVAAFDAELATLVADAATA